MDFLVGVVSGLIVAAIAWVIGRSRSWKGKRDAVNRVMREKTLVIELTDEDIFHKFQNMGLRFGVLYVKSGKDDIGIQQARLASSTNRYETSIIAYHMQVLNEVHWFEEGGDNSYFTTMRFVGALGFQFKCFVDFGNNDFAEIKSLLEECDFTSVAEGAGQMQRAWFLLPAYYRVTTYWTGDNLWNNFYYPA